MERIALYNDSYQNWKSHQISPAQLILTDIPYQLGNKAYGSSCEWYEGGIIVMENQVKRIKPFLIRIQKQDSEFQSSFISALIS